MKSIVIFAMLTTAAALVSTENVQRFDNYRVYTLNVTSEEHLQALYRLENDQEWHFWRLAHRVGSEADVMVAPAQMLAFKELTEQLQLDSNLKITNVQR